MAARTPRIDPSITTSASPTPAPEVLYRRRTTATRWIAAPAANDAAADPTYAHRSSTTHAANDDATRPARRPHTYAPNAARDLDNLARLLPTLEGRSRAIDADPGSRRAYRDDDRIRERQLALSTLRRLDVLTTIDGGRHTRVLYFVYVAVGEVECANWEAAYAPFDARVGLVFADRERRIVWLMERARSLGLFQARVFGEALRARATDLYQSLDDDTVANAQRAPRVSVTAVRDEVSRLVRETDEAIRALWALV